MALIPVNIRALRDNGTLEVHWPDGSVHRVPFRFLRGRCPCAHCVDELTGRRIVDFDAVPAGIQPTGMEFTGNYALKITWNDGHSTGLYTWDYLAQIGREHDA